MTSAHSTLTAVDFARQTHPTARRLAVPPEGAITDAEDVVCVDLRTGGPHRIEEAYWSWSVGTPIPYDTPGCLVLDYMYRDASNYKASATVRIPGPFSRADLALLLGTLSAGDDWDFIPHQVGLDDLQARLSSNPDFGEDGDDHVWHTLQEVSWEAPGQTLPSTSDAQTVDWALMEPRLRSVAVRGYDIVAALDHLDADSGW